MSLFCSTSSHNKRILSFSKFQGLGNDFIIVNNTSQSHPFVSKEDAVFMCQRNFGIGADGVISVFAGSNDCDYSVVILNADGSEAEMCGNGIRCVAQFLVHLENKLEVKEPVGYTIFTKAGRIVTEVFCGSVKVDMGKPHLSPHEIPTTLSASDHAVISCPMTICDTVVNVTCVSMGNPHAVVIVPSLEGMNPPFAKIGSALSSANEFFPKETNAEFVEVLNRNHVRLKVWERGSGATLACGTGACATVVACVLNGVTETKVIVTLPGGDLFIEWLEATGHVHMTGPARLVFEGSISL